MRLKRAVAAQRRELTRLRSADEELVVSRGFFSSLSLPELSAVATILCVKLKSHSCVKQFAVLI